MTIWISLFVLMVCEALFVAYFVAKFAYNKGFDQGWFCGGFHMLKIARHRGFDQADHVLEGLRMAMKVDSAFDPGDPCK